MPSHDLVRDFRFSEPASASGGLSVALGVTPVVIAALSGPGSFPHVDPDDRVWLSAVVGWQATTNGAGVGRTDVRFELHRDSPMGPLVYSAVDSSEASFDKLEVSALMHVDYNHRGTCVPYFLMASAPLSGSAAVVVGPLTLVGQLIERVHDS